MIILKKKCGGANHGVYGIKCFNVKKRLQQMLEVRLKGMALLQNTAKP